MIDVEITGIIKEINHLINSGMLPPTNNRRKIGIYKARTLDGKIRCGWHFCDKNIQAGDKFHYDHGVGIERNNDGEYLLFLEHVE